MDYNIFDGHCDTMYELLIENKDGNIVKNNLHFSFNNTKDYKKYIQVLALYSDPKRNNNGYMKEFLKETLFHLKENNIKIIKDFKDLKENNYGVVLGIEGADEINSIEDLYYFYNKGIRVLTLTWNGKNKIGYGALSGCNNGLTSFGKEVVSEINNLKMAVDVSHLNERGFYDCIELSGKPIIASHSCSYTLCSHKRNLKDEQFKALIKNKGVCGINFCIDFLNENGRADIEDVVRHIEYFCSLGGEKNIGLGSDFDGIPALPFGLSSNKDIYLILNELLKLNYNEENVKNIAFYNFYNLFFEILK